ncbi:MAG: Penicillin-resistant DD-carboxypeptidase [Parcubacteria bacterium C7867-004]|nr:MAG: Penicillin-resistant DD-carboxypeptidase [Parcubacteria bacterium C7867-004]
MRILSLFVPVLSAIAFVPATAFAANATFFGPLVPEACRSCPCGFAGVLQIIQNFMNLGISLSIIIATIIIAAGGFMYILSSTNPESRSKANKMLMNAVIGLLIVLSAWLIVDFVMKSLYGGQFGPWNSILRGGDECVVSRPTQRLFSGDLFVLPGGITGGGVEQGTGNGTGPNCPVPAESTMVAFPAEAVAGGSGKATPDTVANFMAMREAAKKDGIVLKVSSAYRSDAAQVSLWNSLGRDTSKVAKPCSLGGGGSNHNSGAAVDIEVGCGNPSSNCNTATYKWLKANGGKWNFRNALPTDPPHWSPSGT